MFSALRSAFDALPMPPEKAGFDGLGIVMVIAGVTAHICNFTQRNNYQLLLGKPAVGHGIW